MVASPPDNSRAQVGDKRPRALLVAFGSVLDPRHGIAVRARSLADALADLGVRVTLISSEEPVSPIPASIDAMHVLRQPLRFWFSMELVRETRLRARESDVVIVESALLLPSVELARPKIPVVWDTNECETLHYSRLEPTFTNRLRGLVWRQIERWAVRRTDIVVAVSESEGSWWTRLFPASREKLAVVHHRSLAQAMPSGVARAQFERLCNASVRGRVLLFVGNLSAKHNAAAASWLLGELAPRLPADCSLVLAGPGTEALSAPDRTRAHVLCLGSVPDVDVVVARADICLAPLKAGAGVKTKVLDYLAHGKVVVATPVAMEGLEDAPGVCTAELEHFAARVLELLSRSDDLEAAERRRTSQRAWIRAQHSRERIAEELRSALQRVGLEIS